MTNLAQALFQRRTPLAFLVGLGLLIALTSGCARSATPNPSTPAASLEGPHGGTPAAMPVPDATASLPPPDFAAATEAEEPAEAAPEASGLEAPSPTAAEPADSGSVDHTVQPGDTLLGLAREYGVPMAAIQLNNQMGGSTVVRTGETLSIPSREAWTDSPAFWIVHEVDAGETLIGIARTYNVEPRELQSVNNLDDADRLTVGQNLVLPLTGPAGPRVVVASPVPVPTSAPTPSATGEASDTPEATDLTEPTAPPSSPPGNLADWPREIARLINEVRAEHSLRPLTFHLTLERAAQAHADDCAQRGWCSHTGSDGSDIRTRLLRVGYDGTGWAECWAQTQTPLRAVEVWMNETPPNDPHRRTLLTTWFSEIGVGVADATWGTYIIANFGRP